MCLPRGVCVCFCVAEESTEVCVSKREEDERGNILTCRWSVFNVVCEHKCSNSDMMAAAYVHCAAH